MKARMWLCGLLLLTVSPLGAGERLALKVSPWVSFAPANLVVRTTVEVDTANRVMAVSAESSEFSRVSEIQVDGDKAPRTTQLEFHDLPPGRYDVKATLFGSDGRARACVHQEVAVLASGTSR